MEEKYSKGELAKKILKGLAIGGIIAMSLALPNLPQILTLFGADNYKKRSRMEKSLASLKRQKFVKIYFKKGKEVVEITEKGRKRVLEYKFDEMIIKKPKKWDGLWRVVAFDIPETKKLGRDALTQKLKRLNFFQLQKSVYICPFECRDEIDFVGEIFHIRDHITYMVIREIDKNIEVLLKSNFSL